MLGLNFMVQFKNQIYIAANTDLNDSVEEGGIASKILF